jgi:protein tyrosine/serine phosphatase
MAEPISRLIRFEGMVNFRDLGGVAADAGRVRTGMLYRSDSVAYASEVDAARLVEELGVVTVIDLRGDEELALHGRGPLEASAVRYVRAPIVVETQTALQVEYYLAMLAQRGAELVSALRQFTDPANLPAVIHCEAGCDRTGMASAILLELLGVADEEICADYGQTCLAVPSINARLQLIAQRHGLPAPIGYADDLWMPTEAVMAETLARMRQRWTDAVGWAIEQGMTIDEIEALRSVLVE